MLDVRYCVETDDGALVYVSYSGRVDLSGGTGAAPIYATPLFETGDPRYKWLNTIQAVAKGLADGTGLSPTRYTSCAEGYCLRQPAVHTCHSRHTTACYMDEVP